MFFVTVLLQKCFQGIASSSDVVRKQISKLKSCFDLVIGKKWVLHSDAHNLHWTITEKMFLKMRIYEHLRQETTLKQKHYN